MRLNEMKQGLLLWGLPSRQGIAEIKRKLAAAYGLYVIVPEMRPLLLGLEVVKRLTEEGINHLYATDNMLGMLFFKYKVKEVLFFYKDLTEQCFSGICGSLYVCLLACLHNVPIKPLQGEKMMSSVLSASLLDEYMRFHGGDIVQTEDESVSQEIIR
jgi:translation initiation factor 2B subunit (eIF-2B alpha/beta/delta family)